MSTPSTIEVEFAPGRRLTMDVHVSGVPQFCLCRLSRQPNGTYIPVPVQWASMMRLGKNLATELGLPINEHTLRRLVKAGFVKGYVVAPSTTMVDLVSLYKHLQATRTDLDQPCFWTRENLQRWQEACGPLKEPV